MKVLKKVLIGIGIVLVVLVVVVALFPRADHQNQRRNHWPAGCGSGNDS